MRLKNGMTSSRTAISIGAAAQSSRGSGIRNSKRNSHALTNEPRISPICNPSTKRARQRNRREDALPMILIGQIEDVNREIDEDIDEDIDTDPLVCGL